MCEGPHFVKLSLWSLNGDHRCTGYDYLITRTQFCIADMNIHQLLGHRFLICIKSLNDKNIFIYFRDRVNEKLGHLKTSSQAQYL